MADGSGDLVRNNRKAITREKIMRAAVAHFAEGGFDGASIQSIVDDAEVAQGTVFWHFGTKLALYIEVARWAGRQFFDAMRHEVETEGPPPSMASLAERQFAFLDEHPHIARLALSLAVESTGPHPELRPAMAHFSRQFTDVWRQWARRSIACGELADTLNPDDVGVMVASALAGATLGARFAGADARRRFQDLVALLEAGCAGAPDVSRRADAAAVCRG